MKNKSSSRQKRRHLISLIVSLAISTTPALGQEEQLGKYYQQLIETYQTELQENRKKGPEGRAEEIDILRNAGTAYQYLNQPQKALELHEQALTVARQIKDRGREIGIVQNMATAHSKLGDDNGINFLNRQLNEMEKAGDKESQEIILNILIPAYLMTGDYFRSFDAAKKQYLLAIEFKKPESENTALIMIISSCMATENYNQAIDYSQKLLTLGEKQQNQITKRTALYYLNNLYRLVGEPEKALEISQQLIQLAQAKNDPQEEWLAWQYLGLNHTEAGNSEKAIKAFEKALEISTKTNNTFAQAENLKNLSLVYSYLENYPKATELQNQSFALYQKYDNKQQAIFHQSSLLNAAQIYLRTKQFSQAETELKKALEIGEIVKEQNLKNLQLSSLSVDDWQIFISSSNSAIYKDLQQALIGQNKIEEALEIAEKARGRAIVNLLAKRLLTQTANEVEKQQLIAANVKAPNLAEIREIARKNKTTLVQYSVIYENNDFNSPVRFSTNKTKEKELYVWVIKPTGEIAFRQVDLSQLRGGEKRGVNKKSPLEGLVNNSRQSIGIRGNTIETNPKNQPTPATENEKMQQLYKLLIEPIAEFLPKNPEERVTFIPQDGLFLVPFAALKDSTGKYLIEKHTILTAPSIQVIELASQQRKQNQNTTNDILIVGNPTMPSIRYDLESQPQALSPLPGAEKEAQEIAALLNTQALIGSQATETVITEKMPNSRIIHLATHGLLDEMVGFQSSLAFTPTDKADGLLTTREILNLKLNADLVVLSACDTGRGSINGDGVVGLSRSFIGAGVQSVIVSLWAVPDSPTAVLMTEFYRQLEQTKDKAKALRQAMLKTKEKYPLPKDWAGFTLIGEAE
ncbi:MAG TPA: CHAT domain-containing tetratricopeptide repeat protein [Halomicronema sp.]